MILLSLLFSSSAFAASFSFNNENCTVGVDNDVLFEIDSQNFKSEVKSELIFSGVVPLPKIRLTFLQHEPTNATIQWRSILLERKKQKFFRPELVDRLRQEEAQIFPMKRMSPVGQIAIYETTDLDLGRAQDLVALFLSQNEFIISATTERGDVWEAKQSLNSSDASYRKLAATCYPELSSAYLKSNGERIPFKNEIKNLSPMAIPISEGYGLTGFTWMEELLPVSLRGTNALAIGAGADETKISSLVTLLRQKRDAQAVFESETTNPDYIALNGELAGYYEQLTQIYARFVIVTDNNPEATDSLIAQKVNEQKNLTQALALLTSQIDEQTNAKVPLEQEFSAAEQVLAPHLQQLATFDQSVADFTKKLKDIELLQKHLSTLLEQQQKILGDQAASLGGEITAPWSTDEIEAKSKENEDRQKQIQLVIAMRAQIESIAGDTQLLVEKAVAHQTAAQAYLEAVNQQRVNKDKLAAEELWLRQNLEVPHFTIAGVDFFNTLNQSVEQQITDSKAVRDYDGEFETHSALYEKAQANFVKLVEDARQGGASLFAAVLCDPNVLMDEKNRNRPCLTIDEVLNEKNSSLFFEGLPPRDLDIFLNKVEQPWTENLSKPQVLIDRLQTEINQPTEKMQPMVDAWGALRHIIWRWVTMQKESAALDACPDPKPVELYQDKIFSAPFYERVFQCEKTQVAEHENARALALTTVNEGPALIAQANEIYNQADAEFSSATEVFMITADIKVKSVSEKANFSQLFVSCLFPMEKAEECASSINTSLVDSATHITQEQAIYLDLSKALVMNINARLTALSNETNDLVVQTQQLQQSKTDYLAQNNIEALMSNKAGIKARLESTTQQIADLTQAKQQQNVALGLAAQQENVFRKEAQSLVTQIQSVSSQISQLLPAYQPFCAAILPSSEKMQLIDEQVYELFGKDKDLIAAKPYSSCQMPSLDHFIPNTLFLAPTRIPLR